MDISEWQGRVGDSWADEWQRTDRSFTELQTALIDRVGAFAPDVRTIVDLGCGAGTTSLALAGRYPEARIFGLDISKTLLEVARSRTHLPNCSFEVADASNWQPEGVVPQLYVSRHGVMFFADPVSAFGHLANIAAQDARLIFSCFRAPRLNAWASELLALFPQAPASDPRAPGPFAFADQDYVRGILEEAGWTQIRAEPVDFSYIAGAGEDPVQDAVEYFSRIGPAARALRDLDPTLRPVIIEKLEALLRNHLAEGTVTLKAAAWIWSATRQQGKDV
jgi:SAM-dependent methyltransferase